MQTAPFVGSKIRTKSGMEHLFKLTHFIKKQKLLWATKQVESYAHLLLIMLIYGRHKSKAGWWHLFRLSHLINVEKLWKLLVSGYGRLTHLCRSNVFSPSFSIESVSRRVNGNVHKTYMLGMHDGTLSCAPYWANLFCQHGKLSICRRICPSWNKPEYGINLFPLLDILPRILLCFGSSIAIALPAEQMHWEAYLPTEPTNLVAISLVPITQLFSQPWSGFIGFVPGPTKLGWWVTRGVHLGWVSAHANASSQCIYFLGEKRGWSIPPKCCCWDIEGSLW